MADSRFFDRAGPHSLAALAELSGARLLDPDDGGRLIEDVAPLETAGPDDVTFLDNRKYTDAFARSRAGAAFIDERVADKAPRRDVAAGYARAVQGIRARGPGLLPGQRAAAGTCAQRDHRSDRDRAGGLRDRGSCRYRGRRPFGRAVPDRPEYRYRGGGRDRR